MVEAPPGMRTRTAAAMRRCRPPPPRRRPRAAPLLRALLCCSAAAGTVRGSSAPVCDALDGVVYAPPTADIVIKIGVVATLEGKWAASYQNGYCQVFTMWMDFFRKNKTARAGLGVPVKNGHAGLSWVVRNVWLDGSSGSPSAWQHSTRAVTEGLIRDHDPDAIVAPYSSTLTPYAAAPAQQHGIPVLGPGAAAESVFLCPRDCPDAAACDAARFGCTRASGRRFRTLFLTFTPAGQYMDPLVELSAQHGARTVALMTEPKTFPSSVIAGARQRAEDLGMAVLADVEVAVDPAVNETAAATAEDGGVLSGGYTGKDWAAASVPFARWVKEHNVDVVIGGTYWSSCVGVAEAFARVQFWPKVLSLSACVGDRRMYGELLKRGSDARWITGPTQWDRRLSGRDYKEDEFTSVSHYPWSEVRPDRYPPQQWYDDFLEQWGYAPSYHIPSAMAALYLLEGALQTSYPKDRAGLVASFQNLYSPSFYGINTVDPYGSNERRGMTTYQYSSEANHEVVAPVSGATMSFKYPMPPFGSPERNMQCPLGQIVTGANAMCPDDVEDGKLRGLFCDSNCSQCAPGTYSDVKGALACTPCPSGSYSSRAGSAQCVSCEREHVPNAEQSACICPAGTYSRLPEGAGEAICTLCEHGQVPNAEQSACDCPAGTYMAKLEGECRECEQGSIPNEDQTACDTVKGDSELSSGTIAGIVVAVVVIVIMITIPLVWHMTKNTRKMWAMYNNNRIAEETADKIATMELDELNWLFDLENPNRIQAAFMRIITQLKEYRKFLPQGCLVVEDDEWAPPISPMLTTEAAEATNPLRPASPATGAGGKTRFNQDASPEPSETSSVSKAGSVGRVRATKRMNKAILQLGEFRKKQASLVLARLDYGAGERKASMMKCAQRFTEAVLDTVAVKDGLTCTIGEFDHSMNILVSWNAHKPCPTHAIQACNAALSISLLLSRELGAAARWSLAVASGQVNVGNVGNSTQRVPLVGGTMIGSASTLAKLGVHLRVPTLCGTSTYEQARSELSARVVDAVLTSTGAEILAYELLHQDDTGKFDIASHVQAFSALRGRNYAEALALLQKCIQKNADDRQALRLFRVALMLQHDDSCLPCVGVGDGDRVFARLERQPWQDFELMAEGLALPEDMKHILETKHLSASWSAPDQVLDFSGSANSAKRGMKQPDPSEANILENQIKDVYRGDADTETTARSADAKLTRLPGEFKDARGRTYHRSDKCLGKGAFGEVWLGMAADGYMVAVKCLRLGALDRDKDRPESGSVTAWGGIGNGAAAPGPDGGGGQWTVSGSAADGEWTVGGGGGGGEWTVGAGGEQRGHWTVPSASAGTDENGWTVSKPSSGSDGPGNTMGTATLSAAGLTMARRQVQEMVTEVSLMTQLRHDNIVQYLGCAVLGSFVLIVMEYLPGGSLHGVQYQFGGKMPATCVQRFTRDIVQGLAFIHSNRIVHRDLKPANVLLTHEGQCKLADFGASEQLKNVTKTQQQRAAAEGGAPAEGGQDEDDSPIGTPMYMPPEQARGKATTASDIWSLGIVVCELCTGKVPWGDVGNILRFMIKLGEPDGPTPEIPEAMPEYARDLARKCIQRDPEKRPRAKQLMDHPFLLT